MTHDPTPRPDKPRIGISACLVGQRTRYDGDHRLAPGVLGRLGPHVEWVVVCPEAEAGFGIPRETLQLEGEREAPRLVTTTTRLDRTDAMRDWVARCVEELLALDVRGFVLKKNSPSCGIEGVKLFGPGQVEPQRSGTGLFVAGLRARHPRLPLADEASLLEPGIAEAFLERVRAYRHE